MGLIESCCIKPHGETHDDNFTVYEKSIISSLKRKNIFAKGMTSTVYKIKPRQRKMIVKEVKKNYIDYAKKEIKMLKMIKRNSFNKEFFPKLIKTIQLSNSYLIIFENNNYSDLFEFINKKKLKTFRSIKGDEMFEFDEFDEHGDIIPKKDSRWLIHRQIKEINSLYIINQIINGLYQLYLIGYSHLDIKPENILIKEISQQEARSKNLERYPVVPCYTTAPDHKNKKYYSIKLIDFGSCLPYKDETRLKHALGTWGYFAPEIFCDKMYYKSCDMWSVGVILWQLLTDHQPFGVTAKDYMSDMINIECVHPIYKYNTTFKSFSFDVQNIIRKMFRINPISRSRVSIMFANDIFFKIKVLKNKFDNNSQHGKKRSKSYTNADEKKKAHDKFKRKIRSTI